MERDSAYQEVVPAYGSGAAEHRMAETIQVWKERSERGEVCGILDCEEKPNLSCPQCENHYCEEHILVHFHKRRAKSG